MHMFYSGSLQRVCVQFSTAEEMISHDFDHDEEEDDDDDDHASG